MHFCQDEMNAILLAIPFVGAFVAWLKAKFHHRKHHKDCDK